MPWAKPMSVSAVAAYHSSSISRSFPLSFFARGFKNRSFGSTTWPLRFVKTQIGACRALFLFSARFNVCLSNQMISSSVAFAKPDAFVAARSISRCVLSLPTECHMENGITPFSILRTAQNR